MLIPYEHNRTLEDAVSYVLQRKHSDPVAVLHPAWGGQYGIQGILTELNKQGYTERLADLELITHLVPEGVYKVTRVQDVTHFSEVDFKGIIGALGLALERLHINNCESEEDKFIMEISEALTKAKEEI